METENKVKWYGYVSLIGVILFFSGIFQNAGVEGSLLENAPQWLQAFDFNNLLGSFGTIGEGEGSHGAMNFMGTGGTGAKDGFLFALSLVPAVMFALGVVKVVEHYDGLRAATKLLGPVMNPILGLPGESSITLIASLQSTDAGASMTRQLQDSGIISDAQRTTFVAFQFTAGAMIANFFGSGPAVFDIILVPIIIPMAIMFVMKFFSANVVRMIVSRSEKGAA